MAVFPEVRGSGCDGTERADLLRSADVTRAKTDEGLITLEWLLIVAAIAGIAATSALTVQRVLDAASEVPVDPLVRVLDADIASAAIAAEAQTVFDVYQLDPAQPPYTDADFEPLCQNDLPVQFSDVVEQAVWVMPADPNATPLDLADDKPALCQVTPRRGLGE